MVVEYDPSLPQNVLARCSCCESHLRLSLNLAREDQLGVEQLSLAANDRLRLPDFVRLYGLQPSAGEAAFTRFVTGVMLDNLRHLYPAFDMRRNQLDGLVIYDLNLRLPWEKIADHWGSGLPLSSQLRWNLLTRYADDILDYRLTGALRDYVVRCETPFGLPYAITVFILQDEHQYIVKEFSVYRATGLHRLLRVEWIPSRTHTVPKCYSFKEGSNNGVR